MWCILASTLSPEIILFSIPVATKVALGGAEIHTAVGSLFGEELVARGHCNWCELATMSSNLDPVAHLAPGQVWRPWVGTSPALSSRTQSCAGWCALLSSGWSLALWPRAGELVLWLHLGLTGSEPGLSRLAVLQATMNLPYYGSVCAVQGHFLGALLSTGLRSETLI